MGTGINISRGNEFHLKPINLRQVLAIVEGETSKTTNPFFGKADLKGLQIRIESRILALMVENR